MQNMPLKLPGIKVGDKSNTTISAGTTAERDASASPGNVRANIDFGGLELFVGNRWVTFSPTTVLQPVKTTNFTANRHENYPVNTSANAVSVTLPLDPVRGDKVALFDYKGDWDKNYVTVKCGTGKIRGLSQDLVLDEEFGSVELTWLDATVGWALSDSGSDFGDKVEAITTAAQTVEANFRYLVTVNTATNSVKLPLNPLPGHRVVLVDINNEWDVKPLSINPNGKKIEKSSSAMLFRERGLHLELYYLSEEHGWDIVKTLSPDAMPIGEMINGNKTVVSNYRYPVVTNLNTVDVTLPLNPINGDRIAFFDQKDTWGERVVTIRGNGKLIDSEATLLLNVKRGSAELIYSEPDGWQVVSLYRNARYHPTDMAASFTAEMGCSYSVKPTAAMTVSLPALANVGDEIVLHDTTGAWANFPVTVRALGGTVGGKAQLQFSDPFTALILRCVDGTSWYALRTNGTSTRDAIVATVSNPVVKVGRRYTVGVSVTGAGLTLPDNVAQGSWVEVCAAQGQPWAFPLKVVVAGSPTINANVAGIVNNYVFDSSKVFRFVLEGTVWACTVCEQVSNGLTPPVLITANTNLLPGVTYDVGTRASILTLTLPAMVGYSDGAKIAVYDASGQAALTNIAINAGGVATFGNGSSRIDVTERYAYVELTWSSRTNRWLVSGGQASSTNAIVVMNSNGSAMTPATDYLLANVSAAPTMLLPAVPAPGDSLTITEGSRGAGVTRIYIGRNGKPVRGLNQDVSIGAFGVTLEFTYISETFGWDYTVSHVNSVMVSGDKITGATTAVAGMRYPVATTGTATIEVKLPLAPSDGDVIEFYDINRNWSNGALIIDPNGNSIDETGTADRVFSRDGEYVSLVWNKDTDTWFVNTSLTDMTYNPAVRATSFTAKANNAYLVNGGSSITVTMPSSAVFGDVVELYDSASTWAGGVTINAVVNGESGSTSLHGIEGFVRLVYVGGIKGWMVTSSEETKTNVNITLLATETKLRTNCLNTVSFSVVAPVAGLPVNAKRGDFIEIMSNMASPWLGYFTLSAPSGETINGSASVALCDNSKVYRLVYCEGDWTLDSFDRRDASNGTVVKTISGATTNVLGAGVCYVYDAATGAAAARALTLPEVGATCKEPVVVRVAIKSTINAAAPQIAIAAGTATFNQSLTAYYIPARPGMWEFQYVPELRTWMASPSGVDPALLEGTSGTIMPGVRSSILPGGVYNAPATTPEGSTIHFSDVTRQISAFATAKFVPVAPNTVMGLTEYRFNTMGGDWSFTKVGSDWKLVNSSNPLMGCHALASNAAGANNLVFTPTMKAYRISLVGNYTLSSVDTSGNTNFEGYILFTQDATGYRTLTVPAGWRELQDSPGLALIPLSKTLMRFYRVDGEWFYELKGDKGADTEWQLPSGYYDWPGTYILSSQTNDPEKAWARLRLEFKTDGIVEVQRERLGLARQVVKSGPYTRPRPDASRLPSDYEVRVVRETVVGGTLTETTNMSGWVQTGVAVRYLDLYAEFGPLDDGALAGKVTYRVEKRVKARPTHTVEKFYITFDLTATALPAIPPANYALWNGQVVANAVSGKDPEVLSSFVAIEFDAPSVGLIRIHRKSNTGAVSYTDGGTYVMPGRVASEYEVVASVTSQSGGGTFVNQVATYQSLGGSAKLVSLQTGVGPNVQGSDAGSKLLSVTIREKARPARRTFTGVITLSPSVTAAAFTQAANFNSWRGGSISHSSTVKDPASAFVNVWLRFQTNGTFVTMRESNATALVNVSSGTYLGPGRTATQYEGIASVTSQSGVGTLTNGLASWTSLGTATVDIKVAASIGPVYTGVNDKQVNLSITLREKARTSYQYSGTFTMRATVTATAPTPPANYNTWAGTAAIDEQTGVDPDVKTASAEVRFMPNGTFRVRRATTDVATGTFIMTGRTTAYYNVKLVLQSGSSFSVYNNAPDYVAIDVDRVYSITQTNVRKWSGIAAYTSVIGVYVKNVVDQTVVSGTVTLGTKLTITIPPEPTGFNGWRNKEYSASAVTQDPDKALAILRLHFNTNGTWSVNRYGDGLTDAELASGTYLMPGRIATEYECSFSARAGGGTLEGNAGAGWLACGAIQRWCGMSVSYGPVANGTVSANRVFDVAIREIDYQVKYYSGTISLTCSARANYPTPPAGFNGWAGATVSRSLSGVLPNAVNTRTRIVFDTAGTWRLQYSLNGQTWVNESSGTYLMPGRTATMYEASSTISTQSGTGVLTNDLVGWVGLGTADKAIMATANIPATGTGESVKSTNASITIREKVATAMTFAGVVNIYAQAYVAPRTYPAGDAGFFGKTYTHKTPDGNTNGTNSSRVSIGFSANGTWSAYGTSVIGGVGAKPNAALGSGTFNANGLTGSDYQISFTKVSATTDANYTLPGGNGGWADVAAGITYAFELSAANQDYNVTSLTNWTVGVREKAIPSQVRTGNVQVSVGLTMADGTPPAGWMGWRGRRVEQTVTATVPNAAACDVRLVLNSGGTWALQYSLNGAAWANSASGTYLMPGRTASDYEVIASPTGESGAGYVSNGAAAWTRCGGTVVIQCGSSITSPNVGAVGKAWNLSVTMREWRYTYKAVSGSVEMYAGSTVNGRTYPSGSAGFFGATFAHDNAIGNTNGTNAAHIDFTLSSNGTWGAYGYSTIGGEGVKPAVALGGGSFAAVGLTGSNYQARLALVGNTGSTPEYTLPGGNGAWNNISSSVTYRVRLAAVNQTVNIRSVSTWTFEVREIAIPSQTRSGGITFNVGLKTEDGTPPAGWMGWVGKTLNRYAQALVPSTLTVAARLVFDASGTWKYQYTDNGSTWVTESSGTYLMPGRTASDYEAQAVLKTHGGSGTPTNNMPTFTQLGGTDKQLAVSVTAPAGYVGTVGFNSMYEVTVREKLYPTKSTTGNVTYYVEAKINGRTYPAGDLGYNGVGYVYNNPDGTNTGYNSASIMMGFWANGTWSITGNKDIGSNASPPSQLGSGTFAAVGLTGTDYEVAFSRNSWSGTPATEAYPTGFNAVSTSGRVLNIYLDVVDQVVNYTSVTNWKIDIREKNNPGILRTSSVGFTLALKCSAPAIPPPVNPAGWNGKVVEDSAYEEGYAVAKSTIAFLSNGKVWGYSENQGTSTLLGTWLGTGVASDYSVNFTCGAMGGNTTPQGSKSASPAANTSSGWLALSSNREAYVRAQVSNQQTSGNVGNSARIDVTVKVRHDPTGTITSTAVVQLYGIANAYPAP